MEIEEAEWIRRSEELRKECLGFWIYDPDLLKYLSKF